jgi:hypothetical protein
MSKSGVYKNRKKHTHTQSILNHFEKKKKKKQREKTNWLV